jgi:hypothetical protein
MCMKFISLSADKSYFQQDFRYISVLGPHVTQAPKIWDQRSFQRCAEIVLHHYYLVKRCDNIHFYPYFDFPPLNKILKIIFFICHEWHHLAWYNGELLLKEQIVQILYGIIPMIKHLSSGPPGGQQVTEDLWRSAVPRAEFEPVILLTKLSEIVFALTAVNVFGSFKLQLRNIVIQSLRPELYAWGTSCCDL